MPDTTPVPDPTNRSEDAIYRATAAERDFTKGAIRVLEQRLDSMDEAAKVLSDTVTRTPTDIQDAIANLAAVMDERFKSLKELLTLLESQRVEMKQDTEKAVQAALAAAKEAVREQTTASEKSILKSETATNEQIRQQGVTSSTAIAGVVGNAEDLKERVARIESRTEVTTETRNTTAQTIALWISAAVIFIMMVGLVVTIVALP